MKLTQWDTIRNSCNLLKAFLFSDISYGQGLSSVCDSHFGSTGHFDHTGHNHQALAQGEVQLPLIDTDNDLFQKLVIGLAQSCKDLFQEMQEMLKVKIACH